MDTDRVKELIKILEESNLESLSYKTNDVEISLSKGKSTVVPAVMPEVRVQEPEHVVHSKKNSIKSPLVGIFYSRPSPEQASFVKPGEHIKQGDVLCIIEAMKVMNEIKASSSGVIREIFVEDGEMVEFDQPLFEIG